MATSSLETDVLVIGAGPAGAGVAAVLARWGHRVRVIDRAGRDTARLAESIPPSAERPLAAVGAVEAVRAAGFMPWRGNTVWWAGQPGRAETFPPGVAGWQVRRHLFDQVIRGVAIDAGAQIDAGRVVDVRGFEGAESPSSLITVETPSARIDLRARLVIDASGRAGMLARTRGLRVESGAARTVALAGEWRRVEGGWPLGDHTHTLVASYEDGWAWSVPLSPTERQITVMVDPARTRLARDRPAREVYLAELEKVAPFRPLLHGATLAEGPWGADATSYVATRYADEGWFLVGDAGSAIDPLSSFGVKKALASAYLAAVSANTVLTRPSMAREALVFFDRREQAIAGAAGQQVAAFAAQASGDGGHPFWATRADPGIDAGWTELDAGALARDPEVLRAFEDLRQRPALSVAVGGGVRVEPRAAVHGREIALLDHLVQAAWPDGVRFLREVNLVWLVQHAPEYADVGDFYAAAAREMPAVSLPDFLGALSVLLATGALRHRDSLRVVGVPSV